VAYKHCALQVYPEHYPIVGENLIKAIQDVTGLEDNDPIIQTWVKAYGELADAFIQIEKSIYDQMLWIGFKPFKVSKIKQESQDVKSFTIESSEYDLRQFKPGQYITVDLSSEKLPSRSKRQYSMTSGEENHVALGIKRDTTAKYA